MGVLLPYGCAGGARAHASLVACVRACTRGDRGGWLTHTCACQGRQYKLACCHARMHEAPTHASLPVAYAGRTSLGDPYHHHVLQQQHASAQVCMLHTHIERAHIPCAQPHMRAPACRTHTSSEHTFHVRNPTCAHLRVVHQHAVQGGHCQHHAVGQHKGGCGGGGGWPCPSIPYALLLPLPPSPLGPCSTGKLAWRTRWRATRGCRHAGGLLLLWLLLLVLLLQPLVLLQLQVLLLRLRLLQLLLLLVRPKGVVVHGRGGQQCVQHGGEARHDGRAVCDAGQVGHWRGPAVCANAGAVCVNTGAVRTNAGVVASVGQADRGSKVG